MLNFIGRSWNSTRSASSSERKRYRNVRKAMARRSSALAFEDLEDRALLSTVYLNGIQSSSASFNDTTALYEVNGLYTVPSGVNVTFGPGVKVKIDANQSILDQGTINTGLNTEVSFANSYQSNTSVEVASGGTLTATSTVFDFSNNPNNSMAALNVDSGGHLVANGSKFSIDGVRLAPGVIFNNGDILNSSFNDTLFVPSTDIAFLTNNKYFRDIEMIDSGPAPSSPLTIALNQIGTDGDFSRLEYDFIGTFTIVPNVTFAIGANVKVVLTTNNYLLDQGAITTAANSEISFQNGYQSYTSLKVASGGTLTATGTVFDLFNSPNSSTAALNVDPGGHLIANGSAFSINSISIASGAIFNSGDLVNNAFNVPLSLPSADIAFLTNNKHFQDIVINDGGPTPASALTIPLNQIGTDGNFSKLDYIFSSNFSVASNVTLAVGTNVKVILNTGVNLLDNGMITTAANSQIGFSNQNQAYTSIKVGGGGTLKAVNSNFVALNSADSSQTAVTVDPGGHLIASGSEFALTDVWIAPGAILNFGDITTNAFDAAIYLASTNIPTIANNKHFRDININDTVLPSGQSLTLKPIGTDGDMSRLRYVFAGSFTISASSTVTITPLTRVLIEPNDLISVKGAINGYGSELMFARSSNAISVIDVATGGVLNLSNGKIDVDNPSTDWTSQVLIETGGKMTAYSSVLAPRYLVLSTGSTASLVSNTLAALTISSGATATVTGNTIAPNTVVYGCGTPAATINLANNYWGTSDPNVVIWDHADDSTRPTINFTPVLTSPAALGATTTIAGTSAAVVYNASSQFVAVSANVAIVGSPSMVNEGTVTFTLISGSRRIGNPINVPVVNGVASGSYTVPGLTGGGTYLIQAVYNGTTKLLAAIDESPRLTIAGAPTTTLATVGSTSVAAGQSVSLAANVTSVNGIVSQGSVLFTIMNGNTVIGLGVSGNVVNGFATVNYAVPAGTPAGNYVVRAVYSGTVSYLTSTDASNMPTAVVSSAVATASVLAPAPLNYSLSNQSVTFTANVNSAGTAVNEGTVTFTVLNGNQAVGTPVTVNVANGVATTLTPYTIPAGTVVANYTVQAVYNGTANFSSATDATQHLVIKAATTTDAVTANLTGGIGQPVTLTAVVSSPAGAVNEGTETFTVYNGSTPLGTAVSAPVLNGIASVSYMIPASTAAGSYKIKGVYSGTNSFAGSADSSQTLTVVNGTGASTLNNVVPVTSLTYSESSAQTVTLTTSITSAAGTVNAGSVVFTIMKGATLVDTPQTGTVTNGQAQVTYNIPIGLAAGTYSVKAVYSGTANFLASTNTAQTFTITQATTTAFGADESASAGVPFAQSVSMSTTILSNSVKISQGNVVFKIATSDGTVIATSPVKNVVAGAATVNITLPANLSAGTTYWIIAIYTDPAGNYESYTDPTHKLIVS